MANRTNKKTAIILSVVSLIATVSLLAASAYAWFVWRTDFSATQNVYLHSFEIDFADGSFSASDAVNINSSNYYPETRASAVAAYEAGERDSYVFAVRNNGMVEAQIRMYLRVIADDNYGKDVTGLEALAHQFSFTYRIFSDENAKGDFVQTDDTYRLFDKMTTNAEGENVPSGSFTSFKAATNSSLLSVTSSGDYQANALGTLNAASSQDAYGEVLYVELLPFLSPSATVESTGVSTEDATAQSPRLTFIACVSAVQEMAVFTASELNDLALEGMPPVVGA